MPTLSAKTRKKVLSVISRDWEIDLGDPSDSAMLDIFSIYAYLESLFRNSKTEAAWLREPREYLGNRRPIDLIEAGEYVELLEYVEIISNVR